MCVLCVWGVYVLCGYVVCVHVYVLCVHVGARVSICVWVYVCMCVYMCVCKEWVEAETPFPVQKNPKGVEVT